MATYQTYNPVPSATYPSQTPQFTFNSIDQAKSVMADGVSTYDAKQAAYNYLQGYPSFTQGASATNYDGTSWNGSGAYSGTYAGQPAAPSYDRNVVAQYDQGINQLNNSLNRLGGQLDIAYGNIDTQFNTNKNQLDSNFAQSKNTYDTQGIQNQQQLRANRNTITDQASSGLRGLLRALGARGAGGSSDVQNGSRYVQDIATAQNNGAGYNYAQNQQNLDTNWGNFQIDDKNKRTMLDDWRTNQRNNALAQSESTKQSILNQLAQANADKAAYMGGNATKAAQPYLDQSNALSGQIDALGRLNPTYTGTTAVYNAPGLSSYDTGRGTNITPGEARGYDSAPALAALLAINNRNKQQPFNY